LSRTEILIRIKEAEKAADGKIERAESDRRAAVADARRESVKRIQDASANARAKADSAIAKEQEALGMKRQEEIKKGEAEAAALEKASGKNVDKAKKFLIDEFVRTLNAAS